MKKYKRSLSTLILSIFTTLLLLLNFEIVAAEVASPMVTTNKQCITLKSNNLKYKSTNESTSGEVSILQKYLNLKATGYYGNQTVSAVKSFQVENRISPTGQIGPRTKAKIKILSCTQEVAAKTHSLSITNFPNSEIPCISKVTNKPATPLDISSKTGMVSVHDEIFYELQGNTAKEVDYQLSKCIITDDVKMRTTYAMTNTQINYNYERQNRDGQFCNIKNPVVGVHSTVLYPSWNTFKNNTDTELNKRWAGFISRLKIHESGHVEIGDEHAKKFLSYLTTLSQSGNCVPSEQYINDKFDEIINQLENANKEYDARTNNGRSQGVAF